MNVTVRRMTPGLLAAVAREIDAHRNDRIRSVHQDDAHDFRLDLRGPGTRVDLRIHLGLPFPRVLLAPPQPAPKVPSALAASLRGLLSGARLEHAVAVVGERALALVARRRGALVTLWVELFGGQANLYVVDAEGIVRCTPRGAVARRRGASKGSPFLPTPAREVEPAPASERVAHASDVVAAQAEAAERARTDTSATARLRRFVKQKLARARRARARLEDAVAGEAQAAEHERRGELLRGAFHLLRPGARRVCVPDYAQDPPGEVEIEVDPDLTPGEQVALCFRRARRCRRAAEEARARLAGAAAQVEELARAVDQLASEQEGGPLDDAALRALVAGLPERLQTEAAASLAPPTSRAPSRGPQRAQPWSVYTSADGWRILVGRDARGNDELTCRHAASGDLFLHVRGGTGSHVIVPTPRGKTVPKETLLDAAALACHFSARRAAEHGEVDYTPRRYVRKPRGAPAGLVRVQRAKTLTMRREPARIERLLASRERPSATGPGG